jgi:integrase
MGNVKHSGRSRGGTQVIRFMTLQQWRRLLSAVDCYEHKLMLRLIYELGCRVSEFTKIQIVHVDFEQSTILFPAAHTKTGHERTSHVPRELMNDLREHLRREGRIGRRSGRVRNPTSCLFRSIDLRTPGMTPNRVRQIFRRYSLKAGLDRSYGQDSQGRSLHTLSVHSLRHSHIMHAIHEYKIPVPIVQRQVGHKTLDATMVYCRPTDEMVADQYEKARGQHEVMFDAKY